MKKIVQFSGRKAVEDIAAAWLIKLDGDSVLSQEEHAQLRQWLDESPLHREQLEGLAEFWNKMNLLTELAVPLEKPKIQEHAPRRRSLLFRPFATVAATVALSIAIGTGVWFNTNPLMDYNGVYATSVGEQQSTVLSDGSVVLLNTNSQLKVDYSERFRDIYLLQGEAHFTVTENPQVPFRVFAGIGRIQALGTVFSVYKNGDSIDITVTEGRVALASIPPPQLIHALAADNPAIIANRYTPLTSLKTLGAGQIATISKRRVENVPLVSTLSNLRSIKHQDLSKRMAWTEGVLIFSGEPLEQVVKEIGRYTTVSIEFSDPSVKAIRIGGRFPVGETESMFDALESNFGLQVTHLDQNHVLVSAGNPP